MIAAPSPLKNRPTPTGETLMGRHGKKYRAVSNGEKNATPNPPLVRASSMPCDTVTRKNRPTRDHQCRENFMSLLYSHDTTSRLHSAANNKECESPRCPSKSPYSIRNAKPTTSASG